MIVAITPIHIYIYKRKREKKRKNFFLKDKKQTKKKEKEKRSTNLINGRLTMLSYTYYIYDKNENVDSAQRFIFF